MNLLRRKNAASPEPAAAPTAEPVNGAATTKKGRPTPKRRTNSTPPPPAPKSRKEALAWQKQHGARAKVGGQQKMTNAEYREAMRRGDPSVLPRRDAGPVRALARDYVDSRRMLSNYLLILFPLLLLGSQIRALSLLTPLLLVVFAAEFIFTGSRIRKLAAARGLKTQETAVGLGFYAGGRAYLPRRWRQPRPRVAIGDQI